MTLNILRLIMKLIGKKIYIFFTKKWFPFFKKGCKIKLLKDERDESYRNFKQN